MPAEMEITLGREPWLYFWLKYVKDFDPRYHCARCLVGDFDTVLRYNRFAGRSYKINLAAVRSRYVYLCGVSLGFEYARNLHVALELDETAEPFEVEDSRGIVKVRGARRLVIPPLPDADVRTLRAQGFGRPYTTCRNFQFGWRYLRGGAEQTSLF